MECLGEGRVLPTHTLSVADLSHAFELLMVGETGKVVIAQELPDESTHANRRDQRRRLERARPDLVSVCLPNEDHFAMSVQVIGAGVDLLVEKPLVFDLEEADTLLQRTEASGIFFAINFTPPLRRAVRTGESGHRGRRTGRSDLSPLALRR